MSLYPDYVMRRDEAAFVKYQAEEVARDGRSRVVLVLGPGGVGKTTLVRHLAKTATPGFVWLEPIDIDDPEYWLMANLERRVAEQLDQGNQYFNAYRQHLSRLPGVERPKVGHETVLAHLRRGREVFAQCYQEFRRESSLTPIITLDTIEAIRDTDMVLGIIQWMKRLPGTLFILAGRPEDREERDRIIEELADPHQPMSYDTCPMRAFTWDQSIAYLQQSQIASDLEYEVFEKLALLTRGHPLWLAITVSHLAAKGTPAVVNRYPLAKLRKLLPFGEQITAEGTKVHDQFISRLLLRYREDNFWSEATQRLAVTRWRVDQATWQELMTDYALPEKGLDWGSAWKRFIGDPWIRMRSNQRFATLHDALAEELVSRTIPLRDKDEDWRRTCWERVAAWQSAEIREGERELGEQRAQLDAELREEREALEYKDLVARSIKLDTALRDLDQLKAAQLNYVLLSDYQTGCQQFLALEDRATKNHEYRQRELLWMVMQPFSADTPPPGPLQEYIKPIGYSLREWLALNPDIDYELGWRRARHLIDMGQPAQAFAGLEETFRKHGGYPEHAYRLYVLRANAGIRTPGRIAGADGDLKKALRLTETTDTLNAKQAEAHKELGYYYRNVGKWTDAHESYQKALSVVPFNDQPQQASIQTNWAYVQALRGRYNEARGLVTSALAIRRKANLRREEAMTLSVLSEVHRYARRFGESWKANLEAEAIFAELGDWPWLGLIAQQKAICLFQAVKAGEVWTSEFESKEQMLARSERLAREALDICRDYSVRAYPSALNRAGRIIADRDIDAGLELLDQGIREAEQIADGWFWFANLIEYVELSYWTWQAHPDQETKYRANIEGKRAEIDRAKQEYDFKDLEGRWELLQGHMKLHDTDRTVLDQQARLFDEALEHFKKGFAYLVRGYVGSHGAYAVEGEFKRLRGALGKYLPYELAEKWYEEMKAAWTDQKLKYIKDTERTGSLLAGLNEIYASLPQGTWSSSNLKGNQP